jgi:hypothetical protein
VVELEPVAEEDIRAEQRAGEEGIARPRAEDDEHGEDELREDEGAVDAARGDEDLGEEGPVERVAEVAVPELAGRTEGVRDEKPAEGDAHGAEEEDVPLLVTPAPEQGQHQRTGRS